MHGDESGRDSMTLLSEKEMRATMWTLAQAASEEETNAMTQAKRFTLIAKIQLRKVLLELDALCENAQLDGSFEHALSKWLKAAKKDVQE